jgi:hypothetical protein
LENVERAAEVSLSWLGLDAGRSVVPSRLLDLDIPVEDPVVLLVLLIQFRRRARA